MEPVSGGTSGAAAGTDRAISGMNRLGPRWAIYGLLISLIQSVDVVTTRQGAQALGADLPLWRAATDGYSSAVSIILLYPLVRGIARAAAPWDGRPLRIVGFNLAGLAAFWLLFLAGLSLLRLAGYAAFGARYDPALLRSFLPLAPSVLVVYPLTVLAVWGGLWLERRAPAVAPAAPSTFDIRDGARTVHAPVDDILAVQSAGNYVEFQLADGRKLLMRATLGAIEAELAPHGISRTHRSWLVNRRRIVETRRVGAGDFELTLEGGLRAPMSRRWRQSA